MSTATIHTLVIDTLTGEQLDQAQTIHFEEIPADEAEAMDDAFARDAIEEFAESAGEHGVFRLRVLRDGGDVVFTSDMVCVRDPEATDAWDIAREAYMSGPDGLAHKTARDGFTGQPIQRLILGEQVLTFSEANDENGRPWIGYDWAEYQIEEDGEEQGAADHAGTAAEMRAVIARWIKERSK